ncbi:MAG TPA: cbb3-type cytochrome c oxidase subunit I [Wenzhouxiangella sp.]|nr:cbb3-type cytochrome c oxidase subunit I [Wenzhouxiangella sp.]
MSEQVGNTMGPDEGASPWVVAYLATSGLVFVLLMLFGSAMRAGQAGMHDMDAALFYEIMTAHGIGMIGISAVAGAAIMWHFLSRVVNLSVGIFKANLILFLAGVAMILGSIFLGKYHSAWTFLYPLPGQSMGMWTNGAAALFLSGVLVIGVGFLLLHLDIGRALIAHYGSVGRAMGWPQLFAGDKSELPPPVVVASGMATIANIVGLVAGATILIMLLINLYQPGFVINALFAKNLTYFFGHVFANVTIYMAVIAVYELLPRYTQRPWKTSKTFLLSWTASTVLVLIIYPHHLLMDMVTPTWMLAVGHIVGYFNTFPILVVTAFGSLMIVYKSGIKWDVPSRLLFFSLCGWAAGTMPAFIDGTISVNYVMHNTLWVPGHFHTYMMLGLVAMVFGFMSYLGKESPDEADSWLDRLAFGLFMIGGAGLVLIFLYSGKMSVVRRFAGYQPEWQGITGLAVWFALLTVAGSAIFVVKFLTRLGASTRDAPRVTQPKAVAV